MKRVVLLMLMLMVCACAGKNAPMGSVAPEDHFLGEDYALLEVKPELDNSLGWRSPDFKSTDYTALHVEPVTLWNAEKMVRESGLEQADLDTLAVYLHDVLTQVPDGVTLKLAQKPGPGVVSLRAAVTGVEAGSPVSNALTSVVPVGILISAGKQLTTGQAVGVGECSVEMLFVDSVSGKKLGMFADTKVGKKYSAASYTKAGQSEEAMNEWADLLKMRIGALWGNTL